MNGYLTREKHRIRCETSVANVLKPDTVAYELHHWRWYFCDGIIMNFRSDTFADLFIYLVLAVIHLFQKLDCGQQATFE